MIDQAAYLELLKAQIDRYLQNPGRAIQTVAESSFDAWVKFYRQDENSFCIINKGSPKACGW